MNFVSLGLGEFDFFQGQSDPFINSDAFFNLIFLVGADKQNCSIVIG